MLFVIFFATVVAIAEGQTSMVVFANNLDPGDAYVDTNPAVGGDARTTVPITSVAGWSYAAIGNGAVCGINSGPITTATGTFPKVPMQFSTTDEDGAGPAYTIGEAKCDIDYTLPGAALSDFPLLSTFEGASYRWYRDSTSTAAQWFQPSFRLLIVDPLDLSGPDGTPRISYLVFERAYNPSTAVAVPTNTWVFEDLTVSGPRFWSTKNPGGGSPPYQAISEWRNPASCNLVAPAANCYSSQAVILGFNSGVGSGWDGPFIGAVDDFSWTIAGVTTTSSFRVNAVLPTE